MERKREEVIRAKLGPVAQLVLDATRFPSGQPVMVAGLHETKTNMAACLFVVFPPLNRPPSTHPPNSALIDGVG
jgi:hypothetical protein